MHILGQILGTALGAYIGMQIVLWHQKRFWDRVEARAARRYRMLCLLREGKAKIEDFDEDWNLINART